MQSFPSNCWGSCSFGALKNEGGKMHGHFTLKRYGFSRYFFKKKLNNLNFKTKYMSKGWQFRKHPENSASCRWKFTL